jgi:hypothetical protein
MRSPYSYGYSSDPTFTANRPGVELYRGGCAGCGPQGANMAGVTPVPSGTYMGPVGKTVLHGAGMRGYGYSSGPGIPDAVALPASPTMNAAALMANLGMATPGQRQALRLSGVGLGSTQDRAICQGSFAAVGASGGVIRDFGATPGTDGGAATRDQGWNTAGSIAAALGQVGGAFCSMIQTESTTPIQTQPGGSPMPPGYIPPGYYANRTPPAPASSLPTWAVPAGLVVLAVLGVGIYLKS